MKLKIGVNNGALRKYKDDPERNITLEESFDLIKEAGFDTIDFGMSSAKELVEQMGFELAFEYIRNEIEKRGLKVNQTHGRTDAFDTLFVDGKVTDEYFQKVIEDIKATKILGAKYIVVHPLQPPYALFDKHADFRKQINLEFFKRMQPYLHEYGVTECIENLFRNDPERNVCVPSSCSRPEEILYYIDQLQDEHFQACLDIGHMLLTGDYTGDTPQGAIRKLGKHLKVVHAHDNKKIKDDHFAPYMGLCDWSEVAIALEEIGYDGVFSLELMPHRFFAFNYRVWAQGYKFIAEICDTEKMKKKYH